MAPGQAPRPALLVALLLVITCSSAAAQEVYFGKVQVVAVHGRDYEHPGSMRLVVHEHHVNLRLKSGELRRLLFPEDVEHQLPRTGAMVMVRSQPLDRCTFKPQRDGTICVASMMAHEAAAKDNYAEGQPRGLIHIKALVMQLDVCGKGIATHDWDSLETAIWGARPGTNDTTKYGNRTVTAMFEGCSFNMAKINRHTGGYLLRTPVPVPCAGKTPDGVSYNSSECPFNEWSDVANAWVRNNTNITLSNWPFRVYIVPKGEVCGWGGMGYVGCYDDCRTWINGDLWSEPTTYFHEMSHNFYLNHAGKWGNEGYDDMSGAMGYCCDIRCHNAPHAHQLGWAGPIKTLNGENWPAGVWLNYTLPAAAKTPRNFLRIWPDWNQKATRYKIYIQYRKRVGYDIGLPTRGGFGDRVMVYSASAADPQPFTSWEAGISEGQQWRESRLNTTLVVRVPKFLNASHEARVQVCHWSEKAEASCGDGLDNDCDGKVDAEDPDCQNAMARGEGGAAASSTTTSTSAAVGGEDSGGSGGGVGGGSSGNSSSGSGNSSSGHGDSSSGHGDSSSGHGNSGSSGHSSSGGSGSSGSGHGSTGSSGHGNTGSGSSSETVKVASTAPRLDEDDGLTFPFMWN